MTLMKWSIYFGWSKFRSRKNLLKCSNYFGISLYPQCTFTHTQHIVSPIWIWKAGTFGMCFPPKHWFQSQNHFSCFKFILFLDYRRKMLLYLHCMFNIWFVICCCWAWLSTDTLSSRITKCNFGISLILSLCVYMESWLTAKWIKPNIKDHNRWAGFDSPAVCTF